MFIVCDNDTFLGDVGMCQFYIFIHYLIKDLTSDFLLVIIIVTGGEELSEDESRHKDLLYLVLHHRNTPPIIPNTDGVIFTERKAKQRKSIRCFCDTKKSS